jgi:hypothetical protein
MQKTALEKYLFAQKTVPKSHVIKIYFIDQPLTGH